MAESSPSFPPNSQAAAPDGAASPPPVPAAAFPLPSSIPAPVAVGAVPPPKLPPGMMPLSPDQLPAAEEEPPPATIHHRFLQQPWVQDILPLVTSLALHATIVIVGVLAYTAIQVVAQDAPLEDQIVIPEAAMAPEMTGGVENPSLGNDPTSPPAQDKYEENTRPDGWAAEPGQSPVAEAAGGGEGEGNTLIGAGAGSFGRGEGFGSGTGDGSGAGSGTARGKLAPFGAPGGGMPGPRGKVFGNGGTAKKIAFACDASGSMIDKMSSLKLELAKAIEGLRPIQEFSIVFFADEKAHAFENGALVTATAENKRKANQWMDDIIPTGRTNPIPGLQIAFKSRPDLVYILTDGEFDNNAEVLKTVTSLNPGSKTRVNTIAFISSSTDEVSASFVKVLTTLAEQNGGKFKQVAQDTLD